MTDSDSPIPSNRARRRAQARRSAVAVGSAAALATSVGALALAGGTAGATGSTVTDCGDSGANTLRQAILDANADPAPDTITITATCTGASAVPVGSVMEVTEDLTIVGPGAANFVLDGGGTSGIMRIPNSYGTTPDLTITGITFTDAGGIYPALSVRNFDTVVIDGVVFSDNDHSGDGGAMSCTAAGVSLTITNSSFVDNTASGYGDGGALSLVCEAETTITSTLFVGNSTTGNGGAIRMYEQEGEVRIANSTFSGNTATANGGAIYGESLYTDIELLFNTVTGNTATTGGGVYLYYVQYDATLRGNVISGNSGDQVVLYTIGGTFTSADNDFFGTVSGFTPNASDLNVDPQLLPLADNGGPTRTHALAATSPVLDLGPIAWDPFPGDAYDQRGAPYARVVAGRSDMGAYELEPATPPPDPTPEPRFTG